MITRQDHTLYEEYKQDGFEHDFQKNFKLWYESGGRTANPKFYKVQRKLAEMAKTMTYREIGDFVGEGYSTISKIINGQYIGVSDEKINSIEKALEDL
jgi:hypothetical protein